MSPITVVSPAEFGHRVAYLQRNSGMSAAGLSLEAGEQKGWVSWLINTKAKNGPKTVNPQHAATLAEKLAGRGDLIDDELLLFNYLLGVENDQRSVILARPDLEVIEGRRRAVKRASSASTGYFRHSPSHLQRCIGTSRTVRRNGLVRASESANKSRLMGDPQGSFRRL